MPWPRLKTCGPPAKAATSRAVASVKRGAAGHQEQRVEVALDAEPRLQPRRAQAGSTAVSSADRLDPGLGGEARVAGAGAAGKADHRHLRMRGVQRRGDPAAGPMA